jgi:hypothetical protein
MEHESELHENVELTFSYEGEDLVWNGDIEVSGHLDPGDHCTAPYADQFIEVIKTDSLQRYNEDTGDWEDVEVTPSILNEIEMAYERTL